jgi:polysaccharide pyruvyl transferase WcaK-like protein
MKILVTGLCLSRNLGGPAMGLTLVNELNSRMPDLDFTFAIEPLDYKQEKFWADRYGLKICRRDVILRDLTEKYWLTRILKKVRSKNSTSEPPIDWNEIHEEFIHALKNTDIIIDMSGISYVGDKTGDLFTGIRSYSGFYYAKKFQKPFIRFIQSYGPFQIFPVTYFARKEFKYHSILFARGKHSASYCRKITDPAKVFDFPDAAVLLPEADTDWLQTYLKNNNLKEKEYYILSPSSVIYHLNENVKGSGEDHVKSFFEIASYLILQKKKIVFLAHMYSDNPLHCDRQICYKVAAQLNSAFPNTGLIHIVEEDLDPMQTKSLIKSSKLSVVSRYHALVAAISTCTPVITMGWNIKYQDLLEYYDAEKYALDIREFSPEEIALKAIELIKNYEVNFPEIYPVFEKLNSEAKEKVRKAFDLLVQKIQSE